MQLAASSFTLDTIECSFLLTPMDETSTSRLSVYFKNEDSKILLEYSDNRVKATVSVRQGSINQPINSSHCQIASLEVYRGMEQAFNISYDGFSLSNGSTLVVSTLSIYMTLYHLHIMLIHR